MKNAFDVVVVGGGLSGLAAATYLGRAGLGVLVAERAKELGGRARTTQEGGFSLNFGAHAVYRNGPAWSVLADLEVGLAGGVPKASGALALASDGVHTMPVGLLSLLTTGLLTLAGKLEISRVLLALNGADATALARTTALEWIERALKTPEARNYLKAVFRVSTYTADLERLSAGAAITQLQLAQKHNVLYLDGGWQTLVEALRERARAAGVTIAEGNGAAKVTMHGRGGVRVKLEDGRDIEARAVVMTVAPHAAKALAPEVRALAELAAKVVPVKVAALDLALSELPRPRVLLALGTDRPTYVSVHSAAARLAPHGGAVVHAMLYQPSGDAHADEREIEGTLDLMQPGWREKVVQRRFLPAITVANDLLEAARGGFAGRPDVAVEGADGMYLAGDWVGPEGQLLDASLASARRAAERCAASLRGAQVRPRADAAHAAVA